MKAKGLLLFTGLLTVALSACQPQSDELQQVEPYSWPIPDGFPKPQIPADNPMSAAKVTLGRYLFYDKALSANGSQSCASCHLQSHAFAEPRPVSVGSTQERHRRNAPALVNIAYNKNLTWAHDGLTEVEQQLLLPFFGDRPVELGVAGHEQQVLARLSREPYPALFQQAFGISEPTEFEPVIQALASFVRSLISLGSPFDRYAYFEEDAALNEQELAGMTLFFSERFECHHCHGGFNFTQSTSHERQPLDRRPFHNTGLYFTAQSGLLDQNSRGYPTEDRGLAELTGNKADDGRFRAPSLRNVALTAPYMHDGSVATLEEVIAIYAAGGRLITDGPLSGDGRKHPFKSQFVKGFELSDEERRNLLAFLHSLTDDAFISDPNLADPWQADSAQVQH